jgi:hypothetical protein
MKADKRTTLHSAYQRAYTEHYQPGRDEQLKKAWIEEQATKARAATTGGAPGTTMQTRQTGKLAGNTASQFKQRLQELLPNGIH